MATWKKILVEGDAVSDNLGTANLTITDATRTVTLATNGILSIKGNGGNTVQQWIDISGSTAAAHYGCVRIYEDSLNNQGCIELYSTDSSGDKITLRAPSSGSQTIIFPSSLPTAGQVLKADSINGSAITTSWASSGGGTIDGSGAASRVAYWSDADTLTSSGDLTFDGTDLRVTNSVIASELDANTINAEVIGLTNDGDLGRGAELLKVSSSQATSAGRMYYINSSNTFTAADKDFEAAADGFLVVATSNNATSGMLIRGIIRVGSGAIGGTVAVGDKLYLGDSGLFTSDTSTFVSGDFVRAVGHYIAANTIYFNPSQEYIELA